LKTRPLAVYLIVAAVFGAGGARGLAVPLYADHIGASHAVVGLLFTTFTISGAVLSLPSGVIADRFGRGQSVIWSVVVAALSHVGAGLTHNLGVLFATQCVGGLCAGITQTVALAALVDEVPMERMGRAMGWFTLAMQLGFLVGPAGAGVLLGFLRENYSLVILLTAIPFAPAIVLAVTGVSRRLPGHSRQLHLRRPLQQLLAQPGFVALLIGLLAATMVWGTYQAYIPILGRRGFGLPAAQVGYLLALQSVANGASRVPAGRLTDRFQRKGPLVALSLAIFAAGQLVLPHLTGFWLPALLLMVTVPAIATGFVAIGVVFAQLAPQEGRGVAMGVYSTVLYFGLGFGPAIFAPLMDRGFTAGYTASALLAFALAAVTVMTRPQPLRRRREGLAVPPSP
jgi:MFS family permease